MFYGAAALSLVAFFTQVRTLPSMPVHARTPCRGCGTCSGIPTAAAFRPEPDSNTPETG